MGTRARRRAPATEDANSGRPAGITCERYARGDDAERCRYYHAGGGCALSPDPCVEWVKRNGLAHAVPVSAAVSARPSATPDYVSTADVASFRALGVQICFHSDALGELWLVPSYTSQPRNEITPEHVATLDRVLEAFPGAWVAAFQSALPATEGSST
jgi:hypothetical protein